MIAVYVVLAILLLSNIYLHINLRRIKRRERIIQSFLSGIVRSISSYIHSWEHDPDDIPKKIPNPINHLDLFENIRYEFDGYIMKNNYMDINKWFKNGKKTFNDDISNDGFPFLYYDYHNWRFDLWNTPSQVLSDAEMAYLCEDVEVNEENVGEISGEIFIYKDMRDGKLDTKYTLDNLDTNLYILLRHIKTSKIEELSEIIVTRLKSSQS